MGTITRMQILYQVMQWKPHSSILIMITNFLTQSAKHGSEGLHLKKPHWDLNAESMEINRAWCRTNQGNFLLNSFAYGQQVSYLSEGTTRKFVLWYKFYIETTRKTEKSKENQLKCEPYIGWCKSSIESTEHFIVVRLLQDYRNTELDQQCTRGGF